MQRSGILSLPEVSGLSPGFEGIVVWFIRLRNYLINTAIKISIKWIPGAGRRRGKGYLKNIYVTMWCAEFYYLVWADIRISHVIKISQIILSEKTHVHTTRVNNISFGIDWYTGWSGCWGPFGNQLQILRSSREHS